MKKAGWNYQSAFFVNFLRNSKENHIFADANL